MPLRFQRRLAAPLRAVRKDRHVACRAIKQEKRYPLRSTLSRLIRTGEARKIRLGLEFDINARRQIEVHQRIDHLGVGLKDIDQPLVGPHFEVLAALLIDVR